MAILTNSNQRNGSAWLTHIQSQLRSFNPSTGTHSVKIVKSVEVTQVSVAVIPGSQTSNSAQWQMPDISAQANGYWTVRGHSQFARDFRRLNNQIGNRLSSSVKILKMWKEFPPNFNINSLTIEKVSYDRLRQSTPTTVSDCVIECLVSLASRIQNNIPHPGDGVQINSVPQQKRSQTSQTIGKYVSRLSNYTTETWTKIIGPDFI